MTTETRPPAAHQRPSGKLYLSVDQLDLVNDTLTLVKLNVIPGGFTDGIEDTVNHRITPGVAGFYNVIGLVTFKNTVTNCCYDSGIKVSGLLFGGFNYGHTASLWLFSSPVFALLKLDVTDYIELWARSISGDNTVDISGNAWSTYLSVQRVR